ncbi:DUF4177 domain-containing protein [Intestinirhabdus alba]|jgi:hypothetical protein|uniref:DUF4177 domain-containing protein n=1 Tax=Intestinirhabdus alba TaxID=2899544 RepID=A0A6L6INB0_9ENTR|nr:DUF4177 domain-containing protein [Intestinirhabdus alba]MTH46986.1 DUF4177 domain-containing protein [Intestinirhabdus alba]
MYKYKMVQIPPNIVVNARKVNKNNAAAEYLEEVVNEMALEGWEFQRIDSIGVQEQPGCGSIFGGKQVGPVNYYVITFRQEV